MIRKAKEFCEKCNSVEQFVFFKRELKTTHNYARCKKCNKVYRIE